MRDTERAPQARGDRAAATARSPRSSTDPAPPPRSSPTARGQHIRSARLPRASLRPIVAVAGLSILLGLLVTRVLITNGPVARGDEALVRFLSHHRSGGLTEASLIGSIIAGGVTLPILVAVFGLLAALFRQWRLAAFLIFALAVESAAYRTTTLVVHRHRPKVVRLEDLPVNASYPPGTPRPSIVVYCGLALLLSSRIADRRARVAIWACAGGDSGLRRVLAHVPRDAPPARRRRRRLHRGRRRSSRW